jgi:hypothetical protein
MMRKEYNAIALGGHGNNKWIYVRPSWIYAFKMFAR